MKKAEITLIAAWTMQAVAWCLPAISSSGLGPPQIWGWQAWLWTSMTAFGGAIDLLLHPLEGMPLPALGELVLFGASSLSTLFFIFAPAILRSSTRVIRISAWITLSCAFLNIHWMFLEKASDLRIGYYLWWLSFFPLSATFFLQAVATKPIEVA